VPIRRISTRWTVTALALIGVFATWSLFLAASVSTMRGRLRVGISLAERFAGVGESVRGLERLARDGSTAARRGWDRDLVAVRREIEDHRTEGSSWGAGPSLDALLAALAVADDRFRLGEGAEESIRSVGPPLESASRHAREAVDQVRGRLGRISAELDRSWRSLGLLVALSIVMAFLCGGTLLLLQKAQRRIEANERQYHLLADSIEDVVSLHDAEGAIVYVGPALKSGRHSALLDCPGGARAIAERFHRECLEGKEESCERSWERPDGTTGWLETRRRPIEGESYRWLCTSRDVTDRHRAAEQIERLAWHDPLTGLPNRSLLTDRMGVALRGGDHQHRKVAVFFLDVDRFKSVNETLGHSVGDQLLRDIANRLTAAVGEGDTVARIGGDQFVVVSPKPGDPRLFSRRLLASLESPFEVHGREIGLGASIGWTFAPEDGKDPDLLLRHAGAALARAKEKGRGAAVRWEPWMSEQLSVSRLTLRGELARGIEKHEFRLFYQPQVDLISGELTGMEALIRWEHPTRGLLGPTEFLFIAEESGLIEPIGEWVLFEACAQLRRWIDGGYPKLVMAVNLSPRQFLRHDLAETVGRALGAHRIEPAQLELEITESSAMTNAELTISTLRRLEALGVRLVLDDFGTGYSSLAYLRRFPLHTLKIDQSFVREIPAEPDAEAIVAAIIQLARSLDLQVVAEGIETEEQIAFLTEKGCRNGQGWLISRPLPPAEVMERLRARPIRPAVSGSSRSELAG
jgi:diguanylate cyclase (GGDEF)-like protein/PAS domain S-box-containing protein